MSFREIVLIQILLLSFLSFGIVKNLQACSVCGCGDPLQSVTDVAPMAGSFRLGLEGEYLTAQAAGDDPGSTESLTQWTLTTALGFNPVKDLSLTLFIPLTNKDGKLEGGGNPTETSSHFGLGDLNLGLRWYFLQSIDFKAMERRSLALTVGSYIPTGDNNILDGGVRIDEHDQLGTGSWGPYAGLYGFIGGSEWDFSANFTTVFRTVNGSDYRYGTALRWGAQLKFNPNDRFAFSLALDGRYAEADRESSTVVGNTGGTLLNAVPGFWWSPVQSLGVYAKVQLPFATRFFGDQTVGATVQVGTQLILN